MEAISTVALIFHAMLILIMSGAQQKWQWERLSSAQFTLNIGDQKSKLVLWAFKIAFPEEFWFEAVTQFRSSKIFVHYMGVGKW